MSAARRPKAPPLVGRMTRTVKIDLSRAIISREEAHAIPDLPPVIVAAYFRDHGWKVWSRPFASVEAAEARIKELATERHGLPPAWLRLKIITVGGAK